MLKSISLFAICVYQMIIEIIKFLTAKKPTQSTFHESPIKSALRCKVSISYIGVQQDYDGFE